MKLCNNLNYQRSLSAGKASFFFLNQDGQVEPLAIEQSRIRSNKTAYAEAYTGSSLRKKNVAPQDLAFSNLQFIEECHVPFGVDEIFCQFSLRVQANSLSPQVCSNDETRQTLIDLAKHYHSLNGYHELAKRIAKNILMGNWLWRNRSSRYVNIEVITSDKQTIKINNAFVLDWFEQWNTKANKALKALTDFIEKGLTSTCSLHYMDIKATLGVGYGDEIYPSQEFIFKDGNQTAPSKQLARAKLNDGSTTAAFHSQKIGAALQIIDDWYSEDQTLPLRINEYGADREYVIARRHPTFKNDFYQLITRSEEWIAIMLENHIPSDVHFIMSVLLKGGLFNSSKD